MSDDLSCGIDFGTSNSTLALASAAGVRSLRLDPGSAPPEITPTLIFCDHASNWAFGTAARALFLEQEGAGRFVQSIKRYLPSRSFTSTSIGGERLELDAIIARFLRHLRGLAEAEAGAPIERVLLGRPALFHSDPARDALAQARLEQAARIAGFQEVHFRREPIAAARAFETELDRDVLCLVGDLGGGTSDFTVMRLGPGRALLPDRADDVLGVSGVSVAGNDLDAALVKLAVHPHIGRGARHRVMGKMIPVPPFLHHATLRWHELSFASTRENLNLLREWLRTADDRAGLERLYNLLRWNNGYELFQAVEVCKRALSGADEAALAFHAEGIDVVQPVTRSDFEAAIAPLLGKLGACMDGLLDALSLDRGAIDVVFLTGGTSLVPAVRALFEARFPGRILPGDAFGSVGLGLGVEARRRFT